jgi:heme/copper-type cytochrome/quinol oxidase subunit 3
MAVKSATERTPVIDNATLAMVIVLAGEIMFFTGMISAFLVSRAGFPVWPPPDQPRLAPASTALNTVILLLSGPTMLLAARAVSGEKRRAARLWLWGTLLLGSTFVALQGVEWTRLISYGLTSTSSLYGAFFYMIVGAHAVHALVGLVVIGAAAAFGIRRPSQIARQRFVRVAAIYWIFVVALWPILYVCVYIL